jgi:hypothetical protein
MHDHDCHGHECTLADELVCHLPYAIFSITLCFAVLSFWSFSSLCVLQPLMMQQGAHSLFHIFHFMHIIFAATGTIITYVRVSGNVMRGVLVGGITAPIFCSMSDVVLPYIGGRMLGLPMTFHLCWYSELSTIVPFLLVGLLNGFVMSKQIHARQKNSFFSHFAHILVSSFASLCYLIAHGFTTWYAHSGVILILLLIAVVLPCTLSDLVIPMTCANIGKKR